jgi:hypothetical protein
MTEEHLHRCTQEGKKGDETVPKGKFLKNGPLQNIMLTYKLMNKNKGGLLPVKSWQPNQKWATKCKSKITFLNGFKIFV